jgi:hypothetical protein
MASLDLSQIGAAGCLESWRLLPQLIIIPAASLAEFRAGAVACYGSIRRAAAGIGIPYSTLRGWLRGRYADEGDHRTASPTPTSAG